MPATILLTNDDGIESKFLHAIARALAGHFKIAVAAPAEEQSWIGRAVSRRRPVDVKSLTDLPWKAWSITGTPTDCVNIALSHLLSTPPVAVVSGINIGYNMTVPLIYSSGTVAGALEGAFWGLPAFAISQEVADLDFAEVTASKGHLPPEAEARLQANADHAAELILRELGDTGNNPHPPSEAVVHNLNYPACPKQPFETVLTVPSPLNELPLYKRSEDGLFRFAFQHGQPRPCDALTDREAIGSGKVSHSILNFSSLGRDLYR